MTVCPTAVVELSLKMTSSPSLIPIDQAVNEKVTAELAPGSSSAKTTETYVRPHTLVILASGCMFNWPELAKLLESRTVDDPTPSAGVTSSIKCVRLNV